MKTLFFSLFFLMSTGSAFALKLNEKALSYIPDGKVVQEKEKEVKVQTKNGTIVEIEFERNGDFEEASGKSIDKDSFIPEHKLVSLNTAVESLKKSSKSPTGDWNLEKSFLRGWVYEFEGFENGQEVDYVVDATNGKLLETRLDD
jgi:uncharacterized membrane protein YkoI